MNKQTVEPMVTGGHTEKNPCRDALKRRNYDAFLQGLRDRFGGEPKRSKRQLCINRLIAGKRCTLGFPKAGWGHVCLSPRSDHPSLWTVDGRAVALVSEPYQGPDSPVMDEERAFAEANGLDVEISDGSWWNPPPGREYVGTCLVVYTAKERS